MTKQMTDSKLMPLSRMLTSRHPQGDANHFLHS